MARFSNRGRVLAGALGALAVGATLFSMPAAAGTGGDSFFVHSQSGVATSKAFDGYAPRIPKAGATTSPGSGSTPGDGSTGGSTAQPTPGATTAPTSGPTTAPSPVPDPVALAGYKCGPMKLSVTDAMLQHDRDNRALVAAGKSDQVTSSEGWQSMVHSLTGQSGFIEGAPANSNAGKLSMLRLSSNMSPSDSSSLFTSTIASLKTTTLMCEISDARVPQVAGNSYSYQWNNSKSYTESRYINEGGVLESVTVAKEGTSTTVSRVVPGSPKPIISANLPYSYRSTSTGEYASIAYPTVTDGYNAANYTIGYDGSAAIQYFYWDQKSYSSTGRPTGTTTAKRVLGPTRITFDLSGITGLSYADSSGVEKALTYPYTAAHYNEVTGQKWDGKYNKFGGTSRDIPFTPTANR